MNLLKTLWLQAFIHDLSSSPNHLISYFKNLKPNAIDPFFDYLIEIGAWETLFECLSSLDFSTITTPHYAYFRASQYLMLSSPFRHLSHLFPCHFDPSHLLIANQDSIYAFYDYGGLGDYVDNLTRILSFIYAYPKYSNFRLIVPDPIYSLFSSSAIKPLLIRADKAHLINHQKCHISHLLSFMEQDRHHQVSRLTLQAPFNCIQENYILYNPSSGFKQDSIHNAYSFFKRSPGSGFWNSLQSNLHKYNLKSLSSFQSAASTSTRKYLSKILTPDSRFLYFTISQIISSKLFVSVDTFSAHLSLSLGHPTLIIIPSAYDPRWSYYLNSMHTESDPYSSAYFFQYSLFVDPDIQALQLSRLINLILADIY